MKGTIGGLLVASLLLSGCGFRDSNLNPFNWFGRSQAEEVETTRNPLIPRRNRLLGDRDAYRGNAIARLTDLTIERMPGGAIIRATGVSDRNGPYNAQLKERDDAQAGTLAFDFDVVTPNRARSTESERVRTVTVATFVSDKALREIRTIRVVARDNARSSNRR